MGGTQAVYPFPASAYLWVQKTGNILAGDVDGKGPADFEIQLPGVASLVVADVILRMDGGRIGRHCQTQSQTLQLTEG